MKKFEIGKYYRHDTGTCIAVRCIANTTMWGETLVAESPDDMIGLIPINEDRTDNYIEITEKEWLELF